MYRPRTQFRLALAGLVLSVVRPPTSCAEDKAWVSLFNGADLSGWDLVNTPPATWHFEDGVLICSGKPIGEIRTNRMFQNFVLEVEWRHMVPGGNAGIFVWADDLTAKGQPFHRGIEVQVLENGYGNTSRYTTHGDIFPIHGAKMNPVNGRGGQRAFPTEQRSRPSPEWNHYRIECRDGNISLAVNGKVVTRGSECSPSKGYICLESEGGIVHYRNVRIKELPDSPIESQHVAVANRGFRSIYSGLDLTDWSDANAKSGTWKPNDWVLEFRENSPSDSEFTSSQTFAAGMLCDVKLVSEDSQSLLVVQNETDETVCRIRLNQTTTPGLAEVNQWNRIELSIENKEAIWTINNLDAGRQTIKLPSNSKLRLKLMPTGDVDFCNIFVRDQVDDVR